MEPLNPLLTPHRSLCPLDLLFSSDPFLYMQQPWLSLKCLPRLSCPPVSPAGSQSPLIAADYPPGSYHLSLAAPRFPNPRQVDEGVWPPPNNLLNQSPKKVAAETDFSKGLDFEIPPPSPPLNLHELSGPAEGTPLTPKSGNPTKGLDAPSKRSVDKAVSVEVMGQGGAGARLTEFLLSPGMSGTEVWIRSLESILVTFTLSIESIL